MRKMKRPTRRRALSWVPIDTDYTNRDGYDREFLGIRVSLPGSASATLRSNLIDPIAYEHFSVVLHKKRKIAAFTAVNIDGNREYRMKDRAKDSWHDDPRAKGMVTTQSFYKNPFHRGHLVRRLDPAWGEPVDGQRAEADTFHWTNCSPQHGTLNTRRWLPVETHVLDSANTADFRATVFSGPVFGRDDPIIRKVAVPLAYWKIVAWVAKGSGGGLRSLGFVVRQDDLVLKLVKKRGVRALGMASPPSNIHRYQTTVEELERLTGLTFGRLANTDVDAYARRRPARAALRAVTAATLYRPVQKLSDLVL